MAIKSNSKKGQMFSVEVMFSMIVFVSILLSAFWAYHVSGDSMSRFTTSKAVYSDVLAASDLLVSQEGNPSDWHERNETTFTNPTLIGLESGKRGYVSVTKLLRLLNMTNYSYPYMKDALALTGDRYNLQIVAIGQYAGMAPNSSSTEVISIEKPVMLDNGSRSTIRFEVWR